MEASKKQVAKYYSDSCVSLSNVLAFMPSLNVHIHSSGDVMVAFECIKINKGTYKCQNRTVITKGVHLFCFI